MPSLVHFGLRALRREEMPAALIFYNDPVHKSPTPCQHGLPLRRRNPDLDAFVFSTP